MQAVGIICEYNPFHTGHAYHADMARRAACADTVVAVMSEHTTQRGELAVADGYVRAEAAVRAGAADLVVGLPFPYASSPAEFFALAGVRTLDALGVPAISFGSECADLRALSLAAERLYASDFIAAMTEYQQAHPEMGVMACREVLYQQLFGAALPCGSNDLLAIAYLHALRREGSSMAVSPVLRCGQRYNDATSSATHTHPSASACRAAWQSSGLDALSSLLPSAVCETLQRAVADGLAPFRSDALDAAILCYYRLANADALSRCAEMGGGLAERLCRAAAQATDLTSMLSLAATRRYTDGRLRRATLFGLCDVSPDHLSAPPAYVRLLAANQKGCAHLAAIRRHCTLPILTKPADLPDNPRAQAQRAVEERLESLLSLALPRPQDAGYWLRCRPYIEKT